MAPTKEEKEEKQKAESAAPVAASVASPRPVPLEPLVRDAYREAFGVEAGDITAGPGMGDFRVSVNAPNGKPIPGIGASRKEAYENLIERLKAIGS